VNRSGVGDGAFVGSEVGSKEGFAVGASDGKWVGDGDGEAVGGADGMVVGDKVVVVIVVRVVRLVTVGGGGVLQIGGMHTSVTKSFCGHCGGRGPKSFALASSSQLARPSHFPEMISFDVVAWQLAVAMCEHWSTSRDSVGPPKLANATSVTICPRVSQPAF